VPKLTYWAYRIAIEALQSFQNPKAALSNPEVDALDLHDVHAVNPWIKEGFSGRPRPA
jgi:hypothetical protein